MICQECKQRPATIHLTKIINNSKTELHLCEVCAKSAGSELGMMIEPNFTFQDLIIGMLDGDFGICQPSNGDDQLACQSCGLTFSDFKDKGLLGCGDCYGYFQNSLIPLFKRVHGNTRHTGKLPRRIGGEVRIQRQLEQLKQQLRMAIDKEEYEQAAKYRDEIRHLQQNSEGKGRA